jgi:hypothetical protein
MMYLPLEDSGTNSSITLFAAACLMVIRRECMRLSGSSGTTSISINLPSSACRTVTPMPGRTLNVSDVESPYFCFRSVKRSTEVEAANVPRITKARFLMRSSTCQGSIEIPSQDGLSVDHFMDCRALGNWPKTTARSVLLFSGAKPGGDVGRASGNTKQLQHRAFVKRLLAGGDNGAKPPRLSAETYNDSVTRRQPSSRSLASALLRTVRNRTAHSARLTRLTRPRINNLHILKAHLLSDSVPGHIRPRL